MDGICDCHGRPKHAEAYLYMRATLIRPPSRSHRLQRTTHAEEGCGWLAGWLSGQRAGLFTFYVIG